MNPSPISKAKQLLGPLVSNPKATRCLFPQHEDKHKSATLYPDGFHCHACGRGLDTFGYYCHLNNLTTREALTKLGILSGVVVPRPTPPQELFTLVTQLLATDEAKVARKVIDLCRRYSPPLEDRLVNVLSHPSFPQACRKQELNPVLVHDLIFMEVA